MGSSRTTDRTCVSRIGRLTSNPHGSPVVIFSCSYIFLGWEKLGRGCAACRRRMVMGWRQDAWHSRINDKLIKSARKLAFHVFLRVAEKKQNVLQERFQWSSWIQFSSMGRRVWFLCLSEITICSRCYPAIICPGKLKILQREVGEPRGFHLIFMCIIFIL